MIIAVAVNVSSTDICGLVPLHIGETVVMDTILFMAYLLDILIGRKYCVKYLNQDFEIFLACHDQAVLHAKFQVCV